MKIAIPLTNGKLSMHFGHCERIAFVDVSLTEKKVVKQEETKAPAHKPELLPPWLAQRGANMIITRGMSRRSQSLFSQQGIQVVVGAPAETPERLVVVYLAAMPHTGEDAGVH